MDCGKTKSVNPYRNVCCIGYSPNSSRGQCLNHFLRYDWFRQNQNKLSVRELEDPFSCELSRGGHVVKTAEQNSKFQETPSTYSFRNYCSTILIFDKHVTSSLAPRFVLHVHVFCSQCLVIKFHSFPVRCLKDTSWKVATDEITYLPQSHLQLPHEC